MSARGAVGRDQRGCVRPAHRRQQRPAAETHGKGGCFRPNFVVFRPLLLPLPWSRWMLVSLLPARVRLGKAKPCFLCI